MDQKTYITAMQKIDLTEQFMNETITRLQSEEILSDKNSRNNDKKSTFVNVTGYLMNSKVVKAAVLTLTLLLSITGITVSAAKLNVVDIFSGFFKQPVVQETNNSGQSQGNSGAAVTMAPLTQDNKFIEKAGAVISTSTTGNGLKLTARGVVGDNSNMYIAVDVETVNGSAFSNDQQSKIKGLSFDKIWLKVNHEAAGQYCSVTRVDDGSDPGKATFVLQNTLVLKEAGEDIRHLNLTFTNLCEPSKDTVIDIGTSKSVRDIMNEIGEAVQDDFEYMGCNSGTKKNMEWYREKRDQVMKELKEQGITYKKDDYDSFYGIVDKIMEKAIMEKGGFTPNYFIKRTKNQATFCTKYPDLAVSNLGIRNNQLVVKFEFNGSINFDSFMNSGIILVNKKNGEIIMGSAGGGQPVNGDDASQSDIVNNKYISCSTQFSGIHTKEELKDYYFAFGGNGYSLNTLYEGEWSLDFDLSYQNTTRIYQIAKNIRLGGTSRELEQISISPMSLQLKYKNSSENTCVDNEVDSIEIIMKDNTRIRLTDGAWDEDCLNSVFPAIIDLDKVKAINVNGEEIDLD